MNDSELIDEAIAAAENAYTPYSKFNVGAAVLLNNGEVIKGCNIENGSYGMTNCAERTALFTVYAKGYRKNDISKIAVVGPVSGAISPCGACRQVMSELLTDECEIILSNLAKSKIDKYTIIDLLPVPFEL